MPSVVIPVRRAKRAEVPMSSVVPEVPAVHARVVTTPVEITIFLIALLLF